MIDDKNMPKLKPDFSQMSYDDIAKQLALEIDVEQLEEERSV